MEREFKKYRRSNVAEMRGVTEEDIKEFKEFGNIEVPETEILISISSVDLDNGSPKIGDMIARNPRNHNDQWLVAKQYFEENFVEL